MEKATIYDYARMCKAENKGCRGCPLSESNTNESLFCSEYLLKYPDKANELILNWCDEHPSETRQGKLLKVFPNMPLRDGVVDICPQNFDKTFTDCGGKRCTDCCKGYWLAEVEENE